MPRTTSPAADPPGPRSNGGLPPEARYSLQRFSQTRAADAGNVAPLRRALGAFAERQGATQPVLGSIAMAVGEALNNIVIHAYRDDPVPGSMTVEAHRELAHLAVAVIDQGLGFGPRVDSPGLGLGMTVIAATATSLSITAAHASDRPGTVVLLNFALS